MTQKALNLALATALAEIGDITPWPSEYDEGHYLFEHPAYPMVYYSDPDPAVVTERYKLVLKEFLQDRLKGQVAEATEAITSGRGGARPGAGRPKNSKQAEPTVQVRINATLAAKLRRNPQAQRLALLALQQAEG
jgi:hypothetical protein